MCSHTNNIYCYISSSFGITCDEKPENNETDYDAFLLPLLRALIDKVLITRLI